MYGSTHQQSGEKLVESRVCATMRLSRNNCVTLLQRAVQRVMGVERLHPQLNDANNGVGV